MPIVVEVGLLFIFTGALAGLAAGLLGIGGGLIIVPALAYTLPLAGVPEAQSIHMAVATSVATIVFTGSASALAHHRHGAVRWDVFRWLAPGLITGAGLGAVIADALPGTILAMVFGIFAVATGIKMGLDAKTTGHRALPQPPGLLAAGSLIGSISAIVGIGGGSLTVPFLTWCKVRAQQAVATAAAGGVPIATGGFVVYALLDPPQPVAWSLGLIHLPALLGVAIVSVTLAPLGARWAHALPTAILKRVFAGFLVLLGCVMLARNL